MRTEEYRELLRSCRLCPRQCGVNRLAGETGFCRAGEKVRVALVSLHQWEEPCLTGEKGAGTVFFSYCGLRCVFCQNSVISSEASGVDIDVPRLCDIFLEQEERGAATLDLVTPTHFAPQILAALTLAKEKGLSLPIVWNSSGYETVSLIERAAPLVDIFLPDFKYCSREMAKTYSAAPDYFEAATAAIRRMAELKGAPRFDESGNMLSGVLVRHLVLPGGRKDSRQILDWLAANLKGRVKLSLMSQYTPLYRAAEFPPINRRLLTFEYESVTEYAFDIGFTDCYVQQRSSAGGEYVPHFDGQGVLPHHLSR